MSFTNYLVHTKQGYTLQLPIYIIPPVILSVDNLLITHREGRVLWHGVYPPVWGTTPPLYHGIPPPLRSKCPKGGDNTICKTKKIFGEKWGEWPHPYYGLTIIWLGDGGVPKTRPPLQREGYICKKKFLENFWQNGVYSGKYFLLYMEVGIIMENFYMIWLMGIWWYVKKFT